MAQIRVAQKQIIITARWGGKCSECGCQVEKDQEVLFTPASPITRPKIQHKPGECGSSYTVHVLYRSSRQILKVSAYDAAEALAVIRVKATPKVAGQGKPVPWGFEVHQGNVRVL